MMNSAEEGGGKIKSRKISKANTPYSRPQHRRSVLSRVTDSVKNLLVPITPQWLLSKPNDIQESRTATSTSKDNQPSCSSGTSSQEDLSRLPVASSASTVLISVNNQETTSSSMPSTNNLIRSSSIASLSSGGNSSTAASAADKELRMKLLAMDKEVRPQAAAVSPKEPRFNPSSVGLFSRYTPNSNDKSMAGNTSSFYSGPTRYGGLMSAPRSESFSRSPYAIPRVTRVKVKQNTTSRDSSLNSTSKLDKSNQQLSSTALKILQTLEKMATPINDAKKIPSSSQKLNSALFLRRQRKRRRENNSINNDSTKQVFMCVFVIKVAQISDYDQIGLRPNMLQTLKKKNDCYWYQPHFIQKAERNV
jgi:hypothetical protein